MLIALFIGNLAADAVLQKGNNENFLSFRAASSRKYTDPKTGQPVEFTQWVTVNLNRNYEGVASYLKKGTKVFVEGQLTTRIYQDRSQISQVGITINASRIELCGQPAQSQPAAQQPQQAYQQPPQQAYQQQPQHAYQQQPQQTYQQQPQQAYQHGQVQPQQPPQMFPSIPPSETDMYNQQPF